MLTCAGGTPVTRRDKLLRIFSFPAAGVQRGSRSKHREYPKKQRTALPNTSVILHKVHSKHAYLAAGPDAGPRMEGRRCSYGLTNASCDPHAQYGASTEEEIRVQIWNLPRRAKGNQALMAQRDHVVLNAMQNGKYGGKACAEGGLT